MTDAGKLPDKSELISEEGKKRNWKGFVLVGVTTAIVIGLLVFGLVQLFYSPQNSSMGRPYFTRNEDDFLRFEKDGDIRLITVDSLISQTIVSVQPAENTTVEQSSGGFIVLKAQNGEIVAVNATSGRVTIYSHRTKVEVDAEQKNVTATGTDVKICSHEDIDGTMKINVDIEEQKKHITTTFIKGVTWVSSYGATVAISGYEITGGSSVMERNVPGMANTQFEITPINGSTIFERRGSDEELVLERTDDVDHLKARMRIRASRLYIFEKSALGELLMVPDRKSNSSTIEGKLAKIKITDIPS